jgi:peptide-methionine (S)-S-oxide reductase
LSLDPGPSAQTEIATFASGCFWGVEHIFLKHYPPQQDKGILTTAVGYTGGNPLVKNPTYQQVCSGATDHAEALKVEFDPSKVSYAELVGECRWGVTLCFLAQFYLYSSAEFFYRTHDPTTVNRQGGDTGTQYRSAIFTHSDEQAETAKRVTEEVQAKYFTPKGAFLSSCVLSFNLSCFWPASPLLLFLLYKFGALRSAPQ